MNAPRPLILCSACGCEADPSWTHRGRRLCERCVVETPEAFRPAVVRGERREEPAPEAVERERRAAA